MGNNYGKLAGNPGEVYISFRSGMVPGLPPGDAHVGFEVVDGPLHDGPYLAEGIPFIGIPLDAWEHAEVLNRGTARTVYQCGTGLLHLDSGGVLTGKCFGVRHTQGIGFKEYVIKGKRIIWKNKRSCCDE